MLDADCGRRVLVVDDDERVRTAVAWALEAEGFTVEQAADGITALARVRTSPPALVVLDLSLPGLGGLDVLRRMRTGEALATVPAAEDPSDVPVIVLSGRDGETDRIVGLDLGADDYLVKPFSPGELAARVRSVLRRAMPREVPAEGVVRVDPTAREVSARGEPVEVTAKEFDLLAFLVAHPRRVFTRGQLLSHVWSSNAGWQSEATVTEHVHRLRQKIERDVRAPRHLHTVRGVGYRWEP